MVLDFRHTITSGHTLYEMFVTDFRHTILSGHTLYEIFVSWCQTLDTPLHQFLLFMKCLCHGVRL